MNTGFTFKLAEILVMLASLSGCITSIEIVQKNTREPETDVKVITETAVVTLPTSEAQPTDTVASVFLTSSPVFPTATPSPIPSTFTPEPNYTPTPFEGAWNSIDIDSSRQHIYIGPVKEGIHQISITDLAANFCKGSPIIGKGTGQIGSDDVMHTEIDIHCLSELDQGVNDVDYWFTYDEGSDTLKDIWGITWKRTRDNP